jgi:hypothetical protein
MANPVWPGKHLKIKTYHLNSPPPKKNPQWLRLDNMVSANEKWKSMNNNLLDAPHVFQLVGFSIFYCYPPNYN